jgi:hypothetical protein
MSANDTVGRKEVEKKEREGKQNVYEVMNTEKNTRHVES